MTADSLSLALSRELSCLNTLHTNLTARIRASADPLEVALEYGPELAYALEIAQHALKAGDGCEQALREIDSAYREIDAALTEYGGAESEHRELTQALIRVGAVLDEINPARTTAPSLA